MILTYFFSIGRQSQQPSDHITKVQEGRPLPERQVRLREGSRRHRHHRYSAAGRAILDSLIKTPSLPVCCYEFMRDIIMIMFVIYVCE